MLKINVLQIWAGALSIATIVLGFIVGGFVILNGLYYIVPVINLILSGGQNESTLKVIVLRCVNLIFGIVLQLPTILTVVSIGPFHDPFLLAFSICSMLSLVLAFISGKKTG
jgi:hypothetical protein